VNIKTWLRRTGPVLGGILFVLVTVAGYGVCFSASPAEPVNEGSYEDAIEGYRKEIASATGNKEKAMLHKELGDFFAAREDYKGGADEYREALSLYRGFSEEERLQIAIYFSWGDRLNEAIAELKAILSENPRNVNARVHLAQSLSWSGRIKEAIEEAELVLKELPEDRDALLTKANALSMGGSYKEAMPLYEKLLEEEESFDVRLGLTRALFSSGDRAGARESRALLNAELAYQERELKKLVEEMERETKPRLNVRYGYFNDSDDNRLQRYSLGYGTWAGNWKLDLHYRYTDARDNTRETRVEELFVMAYTQLTKSFGFGGGSGITQADNGKTTHSFTGHLKADVAFLRGTGGVNVASTVLTDTAELIENDVRVTSAGLYISQDLTDRFSFYGNYIFKDYSDDNRAHDVQLVPRYAVYRRNPRITLGYRFSYVDFDRQSGSGYFDPDDFVAHQLFPSLYYEKGRFYTTIEPFIGYQSFKSDGEENSDLFSGAYGTFGLKLTKDALFEVNAEGGDSAVGTVTGFQYYLVGARFLYRL